MFTIVTVTYNAQKTIRKTIESVLNQTFTEFEYIIMDGKSIDETVAIAESYSESFRERGIAYKIVSEKDSGIYSAMNKSIMIAKEKWILFMNAGDTFVNRTILSIIARNIEDDAVVVYGDVVLCKNNRYLYTKAKDLSELYEGMVFCHQSALVSTAWARQKAFNETYKLGADYDMFLTAYLGERKFQYIEEPISIYECGGLSTRNAYAFKREFLEIQKKHGILSNQSYELKQADLRKIENKSKVLNRVRSVIPKALIKIHEIWRQEKSGWVKEHNY